MAVPLRRTLNLRRRVDPAWQAAIASWFVARVAVGLGFLAAHGAVDGLAPGRPPFALTQGLFAWDGAFYRDIATVGYGALREEALRFFPLYPVLGRLVGSVLPGGAATGLVLVTEASALLAGYLLHRLVVHEGIGAERATTAVWLQAVLPAASVLVLAYTEALFLALTIGAFLALRQRRWWVVAVLAVLAGACRPSGALLAIPVAVEGLRVLRVAPWRERAAALVALVAAPAGTVAYLLWVGARFGDALAPMRLQSSGDLRGSWVDPLTRIVDAVRDVSAGELFGEALHLPWLALFLVLAVVVGRVLPAPYTAYTVAILLLAVSAESLGSVERYALTAFPLVVAGADLLADRRLERVVVASSCAALTAFTSLVLLGVFVP